jgi:hypothetical protein
MRVKGGTKMSTQKSAKELLAVMEPNNYLECAEGVAAFLDNVAIRSGRGVFWPANPKIDKKEENITYSFYFGSAGKIFFLTRLYAVTKKKEYLQSALEGAYYIIDNFDKRPPLYTFAYADPAQNPGWSLEWNFYFGLSGVAFSFIELYKISLDIEVGRFARCITEKIENAATNTENGPVWAGANGILADGSTLLFLLYAAEYYDEEKLRNLAIQGGKPLLSRITPAETGLRLDGFGANAPTEYPGFEVGTAGAGYVLARLFEVSGNKEFLEAANGGAKHLEAIALRKDGGSLIPYQIPENADVFFMGQCHGVAGISRLYYKLYKLTGNTGYWKFIEEMLTGMLNTGAPENHSKGYWNTYTQCCGTSAILHFSLGFWAETGEERFLALANRCGRHILGAATPSDGPELMWYQSFRRIKPDFITLDTGYCNGAAGIGAALLELHQANNANYYIARLPDDPFPGQKQNRDLDLLEGARKQ